VDDVFRALADPSRRRLLDSLNARNGQNLRELCRGLDMARQSVSKHLAVLEEANLVVTVRRGREKLHYLNTAPVNDIAERWLANFDRARIDALSDLKRALEDFPMPDRRPEFVYVTYIRTTPEQLWRALTEPAFPERYWGVVLHSEWKAGSPITFVIRGVRISDPEQVVLESDPYRRLSYTWHTLTPELAAALEIGDEALARIRAERRSKVAFDIEPEGERVRLTVVHDGFDPGSTMAEMVSGGWPRVLSELKTLLETGRGEPVSGARS
jgi:DNA-binding transcriptional ArsR family regulator/uncharacterized protein YndB with AHSA1/START domain